jgi:hypothetical protein
VSENAERGTQESRADSAPAHPCIEASVPRGCETTRQTALALVVALAAITVIDTYLPDVLSQHLFSPAADYAQTRRDIGFGGVPLEAVAEAIDRRLPAEEPVSLAPSIDTNPLLFQRFCEGLYPRRIMGNAAHQVTIAAAPAGVALAGPVRLLGPPTTPKLAPRGYQSLSRGPGRALVLFVSLLGVGLVVLAGIRRIGGAGGYVEALTPGVLFPTAILVGALSVGLFWSLATWIHVSLRGEVLASAGLAGTLAISIAGIVRLVRKGNFKTRARDLARAALPVLRRPEVMLGLAFLVFATYIVDRSPIIQWDARSIWFFRAKQLFFSGRLLPEDAKTYPWAHPGYPLLYPAALAFFSSFGGWEERRAAVAVTVLFATLSSLVFMLARRTLGRWPGAVFASIPVLYLFAPVVGGYADGYVTLCLLIAVFGFCNDDTEGFGWLGAFSAATIKREGFILALVVCAVHTVIGHPSRRRRWSRRAIAFVGFVPPVLHGLWVKHLGVADAYAGAKLPEQSHEIWNRFSTIWDAIRAQGWTRTPAKIGFVGLLLSLVFAGNWRRISGGIAASLAGIAALAFTFAVFIVTPFDLNWHISTALERLLSHAWLLLVLGGVLLSTAKTP